MSELLRLGEYWDYSQLIEIIEDVCGILDEIKFYGAYRRTTPLDRSTQQYRIITQWLFFTAAHDHAKTTFVKGYFSSHGKEKGIDMKMGVDLVHDAHLGGYDEALVMSGDDDFIYAILTARKIGKPVHLVAVARRYPFGAAHYVVSRTVLDVDGYFLKKVQPELKAGTAAVNVVELRGLVDIHRAKRKTRRS